MEGVAAHPNDPNLIYFSEFANGTIAEIDVGTGTTASPISGTLPNTIRRWSLSAFSTVLVEDGIAATLVPGAVSGPRQIRFDSYGVLWVVTASGHVARLNPELNGALAFKIPLAMNNPMGVDVAADATVAYTAHDANKLGRLIPIAQPRVITPVSDDLVVVTDSIPGPQTAIAQLTNTAPTLVKTGVTADFNDPDGDIREVSLALAESLEPIGIARVPFDVTQPPAVPKYFYAIGASTLRIGRATLVNPPDVAPDDLTDVLAGTPAEGTKTGYAAGSGTFMVNGGTDQSSFEYVAYRRRSTDAVRGWISYRNQRTGARIYSTNLSDLRFFDNKAGPVRFMRNRHRLCGL